MDVAKGGRRGRRQWKESLRMTKIYRTREREEGENIAQTTMAKGEEGKLKGSMQDVEGKAE